MITIMTKADRDREASGIFIKVVIVISSIILMLTWVAKSDLETQETEEAVYCQMVNDKLWPDYKETFHYCEFN